MKRTKQRGNKNRTRDGAGREWRGSSKKWPSPCERPAEESYGREYHEHLAFNQPIATQSSMTNVSSLYTHSLHKLGVKFESLNGLGYW